VLVELPEVTSTAGSSATRKMPDRKPTFRSLSGQLPIPFSEGDHLDAIARGGGWSFRTGGYSGKSRLMIPHQFVAHCPGRLKTARAQRRDRARNRVATRCGYSIRHPPVFCWQII